MFIFQPKPDSKLSATEFREEKNKHVIFSNSFGNSFEIRKNSTRISPKIWIMEYIPSDSKWNSTKYLSWALTAWQLLLITTISIWRIMCMNSLYSSFFRRFFPPFYWKTTFVHLVKFLNHSNYSTVHTNKKDKDICCQCNTIAIHVIKSKRKEKNIH